MKTHQNISNEMTFIKDKDKFNNLTSSLDAHYLSLTESSQLDQKLYYKPKSIFNSFDFSAKTKVTTPNLQKLAWQKAKLLREQESTRRKTKYDQWESDMLSVTSNRHTRNTFRLHPISDSNKLHSESSATYKYTHRQYDKEKDKDKEKEKEKDKEKEKETQLSPKNLTQRDKINNSSIMKSKESPGKEKKLSVNSRHMDHKPSIDSNMQDEVISLQDRQFDFQRSLQLMNKREFKSCFDHLLWFAERMKLDPDSYLDFTQYEKLLKEVGIILPLEESRVLFKSLDKDNSGKIAYNEIKLLYKKVSNIDYPVYSLLFLKLFKVMDTDHSGWVHTGEFVNFCRSMGMDIAHETYQDLLKRFGERFDFKTFLACFDFTNDTLIKYKYSKKQNQYKLYLSHDKISHLSKIKHIYKRQNVREIDINKIRMKHGVKVRHKSGYEFIKTYVRENIFIKLMDLYEGNEGLFVNNAAQAADKHREEIDIDLLDIRNKIPTGDSIRDKQQRDLLYAELDQTLEGSLDIMELTEGIGKKYNVRYPKVVKALCSVAVKRTLENLDKFYINSKLYHWDVRKMIQEETDDVMKKKHFKNFLIHFKEVLKYADKFFTFDKTENMTIERNEFKKFSKFINRQKGYGDKPMEELFQLLDYDGDGHISLEEYLIFMLASQTAIESHFPESVITVDNNNVQLNQVDSNEINTIPFQMEINLAENSIEQSQKHNESIDKNAFVQDQSDEIYNTFVSENINEGNNVKNTNIISDQNVGNEDTSNDLYTNEDQVEFKTISDNFACNIYEKDGINNVDANNTVKLDSIQTGKTTSNNENINEIEINELN